MTNITATHETILRRGAYKWLDRVYNGRVYAVDQNDQSFYVGPGAFISEKKKCCLVMFTGYNPANNLFVLVEHVNLSEQWEVINEFLSAQTLAGQDAATLKAQAATIPAGWTIE
jgi:hypothetical protein